jgi:hypothetical protein
MDELTTLIARLEQGHDSERALVGRATDFAFQRRWINKETATQSHAWNDAGASIDAALTLLSGAHYTLTRYEDCAGIPVCEASLSRHENEDGEGQSQTMPLAICIAALKAQEGGRDATE